MLGVSVLWVCVLGVSLFVVSVLGISMFGFSGFCVSVLMRRLVLTLGFSVLYIPVFSLFA